MTTPDAETMMGRLVDLDHVHDDHPIVIEIHEAISPIHTTMGEIREAFAALAVLPKLNAIIQENM